MPVTGTLQNISPKTMAMIVLLVVMGILWGKVLLGGRKGPAAANAQELAAEQELTQAAQIKSPLTLKAIALPRLPGRNDVLAHDLFSADKWTAFEFNEPQNAEDTGDDADTPEDSVEKENRLKLEKIARQLMLEAVVQDAAGNPSQAYIDDKILSVGSVLTVQEGPKQYVLTVEKISEKEVLLMWNEMSVVLKMVEIFEF